MSPTIRVLILDDHQVFSSSLARVLADEPDIEVVAVASTVDAARLAMTNEIDVVLTDFRLESGDGIEFATHIAEHWPRAKAVMLTASNDETLMTSALEAGCSGFVVKSDPLDLVLTAVRGAAAGQVVISPALLSRLIPRLVSGSRGRNPDLTAREREILQVMARGGSNQEIADELFISRDTVRNHIASILSKLGATSKLQAVTIGIQRGLITLDR